MTNRFTFKPSDGWTELRLVGPDGPIPVNSWSIEAPRELRSGVDLVHRLLACESALEDATFVLIADATVAGLSADEAARLQLPPAIEAVAVVETEGIVTRPDFRIRLLWERPGGQGLPGAVRRGAWLDVGTGWRRIPEPLFSLAETIDAFARLAPDDEAGRMRELARLTELLPSLRDRHAVRAPNLLDRLRITVADAFSLDLDGEGANARLIPVLHRAGRPDRSEEPPAVLDPARQSRFGRELFHAYGSVRGVYVLGSGDWVVLTATLRRALQVVHDAQSAPWPVKQSLLRSPRAFIANRLGDELDATVLETLFVDTPAYSERVRGLGLWQPRVLPWVQIEPMDWLSADELARRAEASGPRMVRGGLLVGEQRVPLTLDQARALRSEVEAAIGRQEPEVRWQHPELGPLDLPSGTATLVAIQRLIDQLSGQAATPRTAEAPEAGPTRPGPEVLLIEPNETKLGYQSSFRRRPSGRVDKFARAVRTPLKEHQRDGVLWLQRCWAAGRPGILLADEMGLGKTLQILAFLAWLREGMELRLVARAPFMIVAPAGLLATWKAEHGNHLHAPGLGRLLEAHGKGLASLKLPTSGELVLDRAALASADWILTTYETLRDWQKDFGAVSFSVLVFDEAQKIKNPAVRLTDAAKAMNAEFSIALTGTPVENRLADLWCIADTVHPGLLGELKSFSAKYERTPDVEKLRSLRRDLDGSGRVTPPFLLRRLRADHLPDLPPFSVVRQEREMPAPQLAAYREIVESARKRTDRGSMLATLRELRAVSLHPALDRLASAPDQLHDDTFVAQSARLSLAIEVLDAIEGNREAALVFVDTLDFAARLQGLLQRRYRFAQPPPVISGEVEAKKRQRIVDAFQQRSGFGVLIMTPRAGGVGLTLTRANHVIHLERWWNPAVEDQCNGRVLRIGQERPVTIHLLLVTLPDGRRSFDLNLDDLLERKRRLFHEALAPPEPDDEDLQQLYAQTVE